MLNLNHLRTFDSELTSSFMRRPGEYLPAFEDALREVIVQQDPTLGKAVAMHEFRIGVEVDLGLGSGSGSGSGPRSPSWLRTVSWLVYQSGT